MNRKEIRVCVLRTSGTNCDAETRRAFRELGVQVEVRHAKELVQRRNLLKYDVLVLPGGFSYGDYVRAGAIWAKWLLAKLGKELKAFVYENRPILGICNGFQVLTEAGLLPGFDGVARYPEAALAINIPPGYNCRWIHLKHESSGKCIFTGKIPKGKVLHIPVAHSEGRFVFARKKQTKLLDKLYESDQLVFRYCDEEGEYAEGKFPTNPNGSFHDIAGICNSDGTIFGLMPHPERAFHTWQHPDWTGKGPLQACSDGRFIFESLVEHLAKKL